MEILILSAKGSAVRCSLKDIRNTGRCVRGVRGIKLNKGDYVTDQVIVKDTDTEAIFVSKLGNVIKTELSDIKKIARGGKGVKVGKRYDADDEWVSVSTV